MTSILDQMTAEATAVKQKAALTPVGTEKGALRIPDVPEVFLTKEAVADIAKDLRKQAALLISVAEGLEKYDEPRAEVIDAAAVQKATEAAADAAFAEKFKAQQEAAQAAVFGDAPKSVPAASGSVVAGWVCPEHGAEATVQTTSARGRAFNKCTECKQFEK